MLDNVLKLPLKPVFADLFGSGVLSPCAAGVLAHWRNNWVDDATVDDLAATGTHTAIPAISVYLDGGSYGTLSSAITLVGDFEQGGKFRTDAIGSLQTIIWGSGTQLNYTAISATGYFNTVINGVGHTFSIQIVADTVYTWKIVRVGTALTITVNGVSEVFTASTTDVLITNIGRSSNQFTGYMWDFYAKDSTGTEVFNNYLASGASSTVSPGKVGPDVTWTGLTVPGDWNSSAVFGHSWNGSEGYSLNVTDNVELITNGTFANWTGDNPDGWTVVEVGDSTSNVTEDPAGQCRIISDGTNTFMQQSILTIGETYRVTYDITAHPVGTLIVANAGTAIQTVAQGITGTQSFEFIATAVNIVWKRSSALDATIDNVSVKRLPQGYIPADPANPTLDIYGNLLTNPGSAKQLLDVDGWMANLAGTETLTLAHLTGSETVTSSIGTSTVGVAAGQLTFTAGTVGYVLLSDGTELIFQSTYESDQINIFDLSTVGRYGTFVGAVVGVGGQWNAVIDKSHFGKHGGTVSGINIIPGKENSTLDAQGNAKGFADYKDSNLPASCVNVTLPETLEMYEAAPGLFTAGVPDATDSSTISDGDEDDIRKSNVAMLVTDGAQTGACKDQTDGYLGV
jgi:hypothetical protein